ncbi:DUF1836 domain-containing protein [Jeotgalibaca sp. A122]|uniref:DUF1836 domain-containing protein n=1 Tax=Jeotgalibaca sp. A122 TaxID=3457322 RepID=UPI003FD5C3AB
MSFLETNDLIRFRNELLDVKLIRWDSLPDFGIYNDQVLTIIESQLSFLHLPESENTITPAMINNYVKNGIIDRPIKKKYYKAHIAKLIVVSILKQVLPLNDIQKGIELQISLQGVEKAYDSFCVELEQSLQLFAFIGMEENGSMTLDGIRPENLALKMVTLSVVAKLLTHVILSYNGVTKMIKEQGDDSK